MNHLVSTLKKISDSAKALPFAVYSSYHQQRLLNVPIAKPLLIIVLSGEKELGQENECICKAGQFVFLTNGPAVNMRNIPKGSEYFALLIEFDYEALKDIPISSPKQDSYYVGQSSNALLQCLQQFVESAQWAPQSLWQSRKKEIIELLCQTGHQEILSLLRFTNISYRVHDLFCQHDFSTLTMAYICRQLGMSESSLRRKLKTEGTNLQQIKDKARLGSALHLLQTTQSSIGVIAQQCGYQSQSRFTERFKNCFGLTPSELRKTKLTE